MSKGAKQETRLPLPASEVIFVGSCILLSSSDGYLLPAHAF